MRTAEADLAVRWAREQLHHQELDEQPWGLCRRISYEDQDSNRAISIQKYLLACRTCYKI